jgi:PKD repeat protein
MTEAPTHYSRARALGVAALATLVLAACGEIPTDTPQLEPDAAAARAADAFDVIETAEAGTIVAGQVLVKFRGGPPTHVQARFGERLSHLTLGINRLKVAAGSELAMVAELRGMPSVEYAEPDYVLSLDAAPSDSYFGYKWGLHNDGSINNSTGAFVANTGAVDADIDWLEAYEYLAGASFQTVRIAILDTGIRQDHEDLASKIVGQYDFFDNDGNAADDNGHGSHTAGIAAAIGNNGTGVTGVAWHNQAQLLVGKICGQINPFQYGCPSSGTASAITWAANNGARVINLSIGGASGSSAQQDALAYALTQETLAFCSSGNDNSVVSYPGAFPECVAVGATDWSDNRASYSNYGPEVELAAPGGDDENPNGYSYILSAYHDSPTSYSFMAGTSMAAPMATGLGGLLASLGVATASELRSLMTSTADDLGANGRDNQFGYGRINAFAAVQAVSGGGGDPTNNAPTASFTFSCSDLACSFDGTASSDPDGDALSYSWAFGDGSTASGATTSHTYAAGGTYTATLTVSDGSLDDSHSDAVTVTEPATGGITLSTSGYKVKGAHTVDLSWNGASSTNVDVYRNGAVVATTANDGAYTDSTGNKGGNVSYTYQVCEAGTSTCSNQTTVSF